MWPARASSSSTAATACERSATPACTAPIPSVPRRPALSSGSPAPSMAGPTTSPAGSSIPNWPGRGAVCDRCRSRSGTGGCLPASHPGGASVSLSDRWGAALAAGVEPVSLLHTVVLASDRRWTDLIGVPWAASWPHPVEQDGVFTLTDGDEHVFVIEPALSALRFRAGLVTTYTLRPTGPRSSRSVISWYVRPADTGTAAEDLQVLMSRDHHELVAHLAGKGSSASATRARERYARVLDAV